MPQMNISKSKFVAGCQCLKRLYWQVHEPELAGEPDAAGRTELRSHSQSRPAVSRPPMP